MKYSNSYAKVFSAEEEKLYFELLFSENLDDQELAKKKIIAHNMRLVAHIVQKYNFADVDDLLSIGALGLVKATLSYNPERRTKFATYAGRCIENEILMNLRKARKTFKDVHMNDVITFDKDGSELQIQDQLEIQDDNIEEIILKKIEQEQILEIISKNLTELEKYIIEHRYGLNGKIATTQKNVAEQLFISRSYVSRLEKRALNKLRKLIEGR